jgi:hypothetical protein
MGITNPHNISKFDPYLMVPPGNPAGTPWMRGEFTDITLNDPANEFAPLSLSNLVVDRTKPFRLDVKWYVEGQLAHLWLNALGGSWNLEAYAESIGPGPEIRIAADSVSVASASISGTKHEYSANLTVPAFTLPEGNPGGNPATDPSGKYKLAVSCFLNSSLGIGNPTVPGYDITGFVEGPIIRVENPK